MLQYHYSYVRPRSDMPGTLSPDGEQGIMGGDLLSYLRAEPQLAMVAYSPLLNGSYAREDKQATRHRTIAAGLSAMKRRVPVARAACPWPVPRARGPCRVLGRVRLWCYMDPDEAVVP